MNSILKIALAILILFPSMSYAAPESRGKVSKLYVKEDGVVLFRLGETSNLPEDCTNSWPYMFNTTDTVGKEWLSMLLAARATGDSLNIGYRKSSGDRCGVVYLYHLN